MSSGMLPIDGVKNAKKPRIGGAEFRATTEGAHRACGKLAPHRQLPIDDCETGPAVALAM